MRRIRREAGICSRTNLRTWSSSAEVVPGQALELGPTEDVWERDAQSSAATNVRPAESARRLARVRVQRSAIGSFFSDLFSLSPGPFKAIARAFGSENYNDQELLDYLKLLQTTGRIEDRYDSDNKARAIVDRWKAGKPGFAPDAHIRILLIREMATGHVSGADENGILTILQSSSHADLEQIFGKGGVNPKELDSKFSGENAKTLHAFFATHFEGGLTAIRGGQNVLTQIIKSPYDPANLREVLDQRAKRIERAVASVPASTGAAQSGGDAQQQEQLLADARLEAGETEAAASATKLTGELQALSLDERNRATKDIGAERTRVHTLSLGLDAGGGGGGDAKKRQAADLSATRTMMDLIIDAMQSELALAAPASRAQFEHQTTPLNAAGKTAAKGALKAFSTEDVAVVEGHAPVHQAFIPGVLPGDTLNYQQQVADRTPHLIDETYQRVAVGRGEAEHADPTKTHSLTEMESIAEASQSEADKVFHSFIPGGHGTPLKADKFDATGKLISSGQIHDAWATEQSQLKHTPGYKDSTATFWMFYLLQNDDARGGIQSINFKHHASPEFGDNNAPHNPEATSISHVAHQFIHSDQKRLDEIDRAWDAFNTGRGNISLQLFKKPDPKEDRRFLWDQFAVLIHEYLHSLASGPYNTFADHLGGESSNEGNTLIEGVDSLLTETVWDHARPRASLPEVRQKVEPNAFHNGEPFDASLLPDITSRRYSTYPNAVRLLATVGTRNLYAAYFYGDVKLIGGPAH